MEKQGSVEPGWFPLRGSYEEAVLSWHEQVESSFRRHALEAQRTGRLTQVQTVDREALPAVSD